MTCSEVCRQLLASGPDEAAAGDLEASWEHVRYCAACRALVRDVERYHAALTDQDALAEPPEGWLAFETRLLASAGRTVG